LIDFVLMSAGSSACSAIADINPPRSASASGLLSGTLGDGEDGDDEEDIFGATVKRHDTPVNGKPVSNSTLVAVAKPYRQEEETQEQQKEEVESFWWSAECASEKSACRLVP
jgi:hypothetical protein